MADILGSILLEDPDQKQAMLEELTPARRLEMVSDRLAEILGAMVAGQDVSPAD